MSNSVLDNNARGDGSGSSRVNPIMDGVRDIIDAGGGCNVGTPSAGGANQNPITVNGTYPGGTAGGVTGGNGTNGLAGLGTWGVTS